MAIKKQSTKTTVTENKAPKAVAVKAEVVKAAPAKKEVKQAAVKAEVVKTTPAKKEVAAKAPAKAVAKVENKKVTFSLPKEAVGTATTVALVGDFNNWDINHGIELKKQKDGSYKTTIELETGKEYQYRFLINGEVWENDWKADKYVPTPFGVMNSVVFA